MSNKKTVPSLRFRGFNEPWEEKKLGEICAEIIAGGDVDKEMLERQGKYPVIANALTNDGIIGFYKNEYRVKAPAVTITGRGDVGHAKARKVDFTPVVRLLTIKTNHDVDFMENIINTLKIMVESTGVPQLTVPQVARYELFVPQTVEEEKRIGSYFEHLDRLITLEQQRYDKLNTVKKSMLEKMFPQKGAKVPEIRFKGFSEPWEEKKLKDFGKATGGTSIESEFITNGKYKVISIGSYSETSQYTDQGIRANKTKKTENRILKKNDLTMILNDKTTSGNIIGRVLLIDADDFYVYNQRTERIEVNLNMFEPDFLYQLLNADNIRSKIIKAAQGNTQIYVNWTTICEFSYRIPCSKLEQKQIADYFQNLDRLITLQNRKIEKLRNLKKACLEKMFV